MAGFEVYLKEGDVCIYCGSVATDRDHVPPFSLTDRAERTFHRHEVVPACRNCNGALHNKPLLTIAERASWLLERIRKKLKALPPRWTEKEIEGLGYALQQYVKRAENKRERLEQSEIHCEMIRNKALRTKMTPEMYWEERDL